MSVLSVEVKYKDKVTKYSMDTSETEKAVLGILSKTEEFLDKTFKVETKKNKKSKV